MTHQIGRLLIVEQALRLSKPRHYFDHTAHILVWSAVDPPIGKFALTG